MIIKPVQFRRKRQGKTNYRKRLKLLLANKPRLVIRKSLKNILAQIVEYHPKGDKVILSASSTQLEKNFNWKINKGNIPSAYLTGLILGKKAKKKGIKEAILDIGLSSSVKGSRIYAVLKGCIDSGLNVPHSGTMLPSNEIIKGTAIVKYAFLLKKNKIKYEKQFSRYIKNKIDPERISQIFEEVKNKIMNL